MENLTVEKCFLASDHVTNYLWAGGAVIYRGVAGKLPEDKKTMIETIDQAIGLIESENLEIKDSNRLYEEGFFNAL